MRCSHCNYWINAHPSPADLLQQGMAVQQAQIANMLNMSPIQREVSLLSQRQVQWNGDEHTNGGWGR